MSNKDFVIEAYDTILNGRNPEAVERYFGPTYIQHNPNAPDGLDALKGLAGALPADFQWEAGIAIEEGDMVMVQSRTTGLGPKPIIRADIVRLENGRIVEHWDVSQEEQDTASGHPMFEPRRATVRT